MAQSSQINDTSGIYEQNYAINGGVFQVDFTNLTFTDTKFKNNSCYDGCLVHNDEGYQMGLTMNRVMATDNWAFQTAALVFVEFQNKEIYTYGTYVNITDSQFSRNSASIGLAGLIYSNHESNELIISNSLFDQNYLYNYRNLSDDSERSGYFHLPQVSDVIIDNCTFKPYEDKQMDKLMYDVGEHECQNKTLNETCEDQGSGWYPNLYLLMYTGGAGHSVTIKNTNFSTHKEFNETYTRNRESTEDDLNTTFLGVVMVNSAASFELENNYFFNNFDMVNGVIQAFYVYSMSDSGSTYYNNVGTFGSVYYFSSVSEIEIPEAIEGEEVETSFTDIQLIQ